MMSCAGNKYVKTPAMDQLAANGVRFDRAYCTNPVCVPSRMSMWTGHMPSEMNTPSNNAKKAIVPEHFVSDAMGWQMEKAGYDVAYGGKVHLPKPLHLEKIGFKNYLTKDQRSDLGDVAADFIRQDRDKPFFLVASFINPHDICYMVIRDHVVSDFDKALMRNGVTEIGNLDEALETADVDSEKFWNDLCPPLPENYEPAEDEPEAVKWLAEKRPFRENARKNWSDKKWRLHRWAYARLTEKVDGHIMKILDALRETGQEENTVVIFSSDHGDNDASRKFEHKSLPYDESARIPFIITQKGTTPAGKVEPWAVSNGLDLLPTVLDYAGLEKPAHLRGHSLRPLAEGRTYSLPRKDVYFESEIARTLVNSRYKYIHFSIGENDEQFFDLEKDPHEMHSCIDDPAYADEVARMRTSLKEHVKSIDDPFGSKYVL
jgi:arylsulfatase A-like enzyme